MKKRFSSFCGLPDSGGHERGAALVIVLGLLAIMIIVAVSFSISSRTERVSARAYSDVVKSRQLIHTSLNRVIGSHITKSMGDNTYPIWTNEVLSSGVDANTNNLVYHLGDKTFYSAAVYIPMSLRTGPFAQDGTRWIPLTNEANEVVGEYSFLALNCSGLLDAMAIGATNNIPPNPRRRGYHPSEINFANDVLPEVQPNSPITSLHDYRTMFGRFETVTELYYLLSSSDNRLSYRGPPLLRQLTDSPSSMADHLHVFSRFPLGYAENFLRASSNVPYIGGTNTPPFEDVVNALANIPGNPIPDTNAFARAIIDFVAPGYDLAGNSDAEKFERISSKRVPMINEIVVSNQVSVASVSGTNVLTHRIFVDVETWYPFPEAGPEQFRVEFDPPSLSPISANVNSPPMYTGLNGPYTQPSGFTPPGNFTPDPNDPFDVHTFEFIRTHTLGGPAPPLPWNVSVTFSNSIIVRYMGTGNPVVDKVSPPAGGTGFQLPTTPPIVLPAPGASPVGIRVVGRSANDPRINWNMTTHFTNVQVSLNRTNEAPVYQSPNPDERGFMYAPNPLANPVNRTVGDLGYLLFDAGKPWETIRLMGPYNAGYPQQLATLLDRFTVHSVTSFPRRGLVNPNTRQTNALAAVFYQVPVEKYPGAPGGSRLNASEAIDLSRHIRSQMGASGSLTNTSDLAYLLNPSDVDTILDTGSSTKFERESALRNSLGLLSTRHNLFTIFLAARTFVDGYTYNAGDSPEIKNRNVASEQRAVAVVWRDPFRTFPSYVSNTNNLDNATFQSWIQYFHWFSGAFEN